MNTPKLLVDFCDYKAAKYAVEHWHYSGVMPAGKTVKCGVWEDGKFIGVVIFSRGSHPRIGSPYSLGQTEIVELTRVALTEHRIYVSQIVAVAIRLLKRSNDGLRLIVSYADPSENHYGGIYQAMNWVYVGTTKIEREIIVKGNRYHRRSASNRFASYALDYLKAYHDPDARYGNGTYKHKYLYPLDRAMRRQIEPLAQPYPKHASA